MTSPKGSIREGAKFPHLVLGRILFLVQDWTEKPGSLLVVEASFPNILGLFTEQFRTWRLLPAGQAKEDTEPNLGSGIPSFLPYTTG